MIIQTNCLSSIQKKQIEQLEQLCHKQDGLTGSILTDSSENYNADIPCFFLLYEETESVIEVKGIENVALSACLALFLPNEGEAEVNAYTHPNVRQQGYFMKLFHASQLVMNAWKITSVSFVCCTQSKSAHAVLRKLGATILYSEYWMEIDLAFIKMNVPLSFPIPDPLHLSSSRTNLTYSESNHHCTKAFLSIANDSHLNRLALIHSKVFAVSFDESIDFLESVWDIQDSSIYLYEVSKKPIGLCCFVPFQDKIMLVGIGIATKYQGYGYGMDMMCQVLHQAEKEVCLNVNSHQAPAVSLYQKLGFTKKQTYDYYQLS